jgi:hypothetical protein
MIVVAAPMHVCNNAMTASESVLDYFISRWCYSLLNQRKQYWPSDNSNVLLKSQSSKIQNSGVTWKNSLHYWTVNNRYNVCRRKAKDKTTQITLGGDCIPRDL